MTELQQLGSYGLYVLFYLWIFWAFYVLVMGLYRAHLMKKLTIVTYILGAPWLIIGVILDVIANLTIATLIFVDMPREWLVTSRLKRYAKIEKDNWRSNLGEWICTNLLDVFDPNENHC